MDELTRTKSLLDQMNVGVVNYIEKKTGVCKVDLESRKPADRSLILAWESKNTCFLPEDLKNFYLTTDGFQLTWSVKIDNGPIPVGKMYVNGIAQLARIGTTGSSGSANPSLADLNCDSDTEDEDIEGKEKPCFDSRFKLFELDPCDGYGKVCLVYRESRTGGTDPKVEIWFLDRSLAWHYITDSFTSYYRLMIMHLGLPQWHYALTETGLSQQAKQWFNLYAPLRFELDTELSLHSSRPVDSYVSTTQIDIGKVFKGKTDKKKPVPAQTQSQQSQSFRNKKPTVASAKTGQPPGLKPSGSSSQLLGKK